MASYQPTFGVISAGFKQGDNPAVSRNHVIHLHEDDPEQPTAPELAKILEANGHRWLLVSFPFDTEAEVIQWRYKQYRRGGIVVEGDETGVRHWTGSDEGPTFYPKGSPMFERLTKDPKTKEVYNILFALAEWGADGRLKHVMPDGLGYYRLRTTSKRTVENFKAEFENVRGFGGHFRYGAFILSLKNIKGYDRRGTVRNYPVFNLAMKHPGRGHLALDAAALRLALASGLESYELLKLPPVPVITPEQDAPFVGVGDAEGVEEEAPERQSPDVQPLAHLVNDADEEPIDAEFKDVVPEEPVPGFLQPDWQPSEQDLKDLSTGKSREAMKRRWFALVKGTHLDTKEGRADFFTRHVDGLSSLKEVVAVLSDVNFNLLLVEAKDEIDRRKQVDAETANLTKPSSDIPQQDLLDLKTVVDASGLTRPRVYPFFSMLTGVHLKGRPDLSKEHVRTLLAACGQRTQTGQWTLIQSKLDRHLDRFPAWEQDEGAEHALA